MEQSSYTKPGIYTNRSKRKPEKTARRASGRRQLFLGKRCGFPGFRSTERLVSTMLPWRSSFGGNLYLTAGSTTGSVALPTAVAQALYDNVDDGTPVIVLLFRSL